MILKINQFVSELDDTLKKEFESKENIIISAPTSSGKTTAILNYAINHPSKKVAFLAPTQSLVENIKKDFPSLNCGYGFEFIERSLHSNLIVTTYDSLKSLKQKFDIVFIDEAHLLAGHGTFRTEVLSHLLDNKCKKVLLSGTPEIITALEGYKLIEIEKRKKRKNLNFVEATKSAKSYIHHLIENRDKSNLLLIRINDKSLIDEIQQHYKDKLNIVKLYSDDENVLLEGQKSETVDLIKKGKVLPSIDVMLCTSIIDAGISLEVYRNVDAFAIDDKNLPNAIDTVQLYARVRDNSELEMKLTVIGKFGTAPIPKQGIIKGRAELLIQLMAVVYSEYSKLDEEDYINFLNSYEINYNKVLLNEVQKLENFKRCGAYQIVSNLKALIPTERYNHIVRNLNSDDKELINGSKNFDNKIDADVMRYSNQITEAIENEIPLHILINNNKYHEAKAIALNDAVRYYSQSEQFKTVMHELLTGYELSSTEAFKMDLSNYSLLGQPQQKAIKQVATLLYKNGEWTRKSIKLKRLDYNDSLTNYFYRLSYNVKRPCTSYRVAV